MDIATTTITTLIPPATTTTTTTTTTSNPKSPEADIETPTRIQSSKPSPFTNGVLKRHHHSQNHHAKSATTTKPIVVAYKECLRNHAASLGGHALDGCGEFMPSPTATPTDPTSLKCAACGCHRNFHRRDPDDPLPLLTPTAFQVIEYQPHHRYHPLPPPPPRGHSPSPPSPPPISSSYYPSSAPHMLLALSAGLQGAPQPPPRPPDNSQSTGLFSTPMANNSAITPNGRKRFRTKFSQGQKEKMLEFGERVGWKMQKRDEEMVADFCSEIGIDRSVLKVWMHNNKSKSSADLRMNTNTDTHNNNNTNHNLHHSHNDVGDDSSPHLATNGYSSSS